MNIYPFKTKTQSWLFIHICSHAFKVGPYKDEVKLFNSAWLSVSVSLEPTDDGDVCQVVFSHKDIELLRCAAEQFVGRVRKTDWWVEKPYT